MALKPTIYKVELQLSDTDRHCYESCQLTLAQHPSETALRMMVRLLVYGLNYHQDLSFTRGLSSTDEPELWQIGPDGQVEHWIELGQASPERLRKAVSRAPRISLYAYGREADIWWQKQGSAIADLPKVSVWQLNDEQIAPLADLVQRAMTLTMTITDGEVYISDGQHHCTVTPQQLSG